MAAHIQWALKMLQLEGFTWIAHLIPLHILIDRGEKNCPHLTDGKTKP